MLIETERVELIKTYLAGIMDTAEADYFSDYERTIAHLKQGHMDWQLADAIGIYAAVLCTQGQTDDEKLALQEILNTCIEPLESLVGSLTAGTTSETNNNKAQVLLHGRFGLGSLLLIKSKELFDHVGANAEYYLDALFYKSRAISILHEMAVTQLSIKGDVARSGPNIVDYSTDMGKVKTTAVLLLLPFLATGETRNYGELIVHICEATPYEYAIRDVFVSLGNPLLDSWVEENRKKDASEKYPPCVEWLDLFTSAGALITISKMDESEVDTPDKCKPESTQHLAWKFGQVIGKCIISSGNSVSSVSESLLSWVMEGIDWDDNPKFSNNGQDAIHTLRMVCGLIGEQPDNTNWQHIRDYAYSMWHNSDIYSGIPISEVTAETDIYWAIRIGLADVMNESKGQILPMPTGTIQSPIQIAPSTVQQMISQIKQEILPIKDFYPNQEDIESYLRSQLTNIFDRLPGDVVEPLIDGETRFRMKRDLRPSAFDFHLAIENCLRDYLLNKLDSEASNQGRPGRYERPPSHLSPGEWGRIFESIVKPDSTRSKYDLYASLFKNYCNQTGLRYNTNDLRALGKKLHTIQDLRNEFKKATPRPRSEERKNIQSLRELVLGGDGKSGAIADIINIFILKAI